MRNVRWPPVAVFSTVYLPLNTLGVSMIFLLNSSRKPRIDLARNPCAGKIKAGPVVSGPVKHAPVAGAWRITRFLQISLDYLELIPVEVTKRSTAVPKDHIDAKRG